MNDIDLTEDEKEKLLEMFEANKEERTKNKEIEDKKREEAYELEKNIGKVWASRMKDWYKKENKEVT